MIVTKSWQGRVLVINLVGEIDMKNQSSIAATLDEMAREDASGLVLNFADVLYIASVGIGMLIKLVNEGKTRGMGVRLAAPRPMIRKVLEMVRVEQLLPMDPTVADSVERVVPLAA